MQLRQLVTIARLGFDAPLSPGGVAQLEEGTKLFAQQRFVERNGVELVAHSPLDRAKRTAIALFGSTSVPLVEVPFMYERTLSEYFNTAAFDRRFRQIEQWVAGRPEASIALVAHGQVFKRAVGIHPENLGVIECTFTEGEGLKLVKYLGVLRESPPSQGA